uniref:Uncharacterized protein n=1 Tax=Spermophilus dauricus TaxID=99837 RepID=A0A8C9NVX8_SPEDA
MMEINLRLYLTTFPSNSIEVLITIKIFDANNCSHQKKNILCLVVSFQIYWRVNSALFLTGYSHRI